MTKVKKGKVQEMTKHRDNYTSWVSLLKTLVAKVAYRSLAMEMTCLVTGS